MWRRKENLLCGGNIRILIGHQGEKPHREIRVHNLVPTCGLDKINDLIWYPELGGGGFTPAYFAVGTSAAVTGAGTTTLGSENFRKLIARRLPADTGPGATVYGYVETSESNGVDLYEVGLFTEETVNTGLLWGRATHPKIVKTSSIYVIYEWLWSLSAS